MDWSDVRVICIAPNYRKYDLHAVRVMGANLELWTYRLFENGSMHLEEVLQKSEGPAVELALLRFVGQLSYAANRLFRASVSFSAGVM